MNNKEYLTFIYSNCNEKAYIEFFSNLFNLNSKFIINFELFDESDSDFAFQKFVFLINDRDRGHSNNFVILMNEESLNYSQTVYKINNLTHDKQIHLFSSNPCFESFLIAHFVNNLTELRESCLSKSIIDPITISAMALRGELLKNICEHCINYLVYSDFISDYSKNCSTNFKNSINKDKCKNASEQCLEFKNLILFIKSLIA